MRFFVRSEESRGHENILDDTLGWRRFNTILAQAIEMELYGGQQLVFGFSMVAPVATQPGKSGE